jgi:hypothetical protein
MKRVKLRCECYCLWEARFLHPKICAGKVVGEHIAITPIIGL